MEFNVKTAAGVKIVRLQEERLDTNNAPELKTQFLTLIEPDDSKILIDLEKVIYVDSSGLGALLFGFRQVRDHGGSFKLLHTQKRVRDLINIAHLDNHLINYSDEEEAVKSFE